MIQLRGPFATVLVLLALLGASGPAAAQEYFVKDGRIHAPDGQPLQIRGINHFGFNGTILQPEFLWRMGWKQQIAQIKELGFNAVRLPFVPDTLYNQTPVDRLSSVEPNLNPELLGKTPLQVLDLWMAEADRQGLHVLLDFHSVTPKRAYPTWFLLDPADYALTWNGLAYTVTDWVRDLVFVAQRYAGNGHFMGIDLYNEPRDVVRWNGGDAQQDNPLYWWRPAAELAAAAVLAVNSRLLVFVEGINGNFDGVENSGLPMNWGEDLQPQGYDPLDIPAHKLVLSPHTYGPDVFEKSSFSSGNFPHNLAQDWDTLFGNLYPQHAVVIGEWGGRYGHGGSGPPDVQWQDALVSYLRSKGMSDSFYWSYTPNSHDTGGILDDDLQVREDKMRLLRKLWSPQQRSSSGRAGSVGLLLLSLFGAAWALRRPYLVLRAARAGS